MKQTHKAKHGRILVKEVLGPATLTKASIQYFERRSTEPVSAFTDFIVTRRAELVPECMEFFCIEVIKIERL